MPHDPPTRPLQSMMDRSSVIVCCGSGGVGKTTTAAVLGLEAARRGRKVVVVTVDPARRLADALGLSGIGDRPARVLGDWPGELWAVMLDPKATFDRLVRRHAGSPHQAERILANTFYRNISGTLSGTQEYMAGEKLYELHEESGFDLVIVDTPPTRNAIDFLEAPERLSRFLNHRLYRLMTAPTRGLLKAVNLATRTVVRSLTRVVGGEVIADALAFFQAFEGMEEGFRQRATRVRDVLRADTTAYALVTSPRADAVVEATFFAEHLEGEGTPISAVIVNRVHPSFGPPDPTGDRKRAAELGNTPLGNLFANRAQLRGAAAGDEAQIAHLRDRLPAATCVLVPFLAHDVHDLSGLQEIAAHLFSPPEVDPPTPTRSRGRKPRP